MKFVCVKCLEFINQEHMIHLPINNQYFHSTCHQQLENKKKLYNEKHTNYINDINNINDIVIFIKKYFEINYLK